MVVGFGHNLASFRAFRNWEAIKKNAESVSGF